MSGDAAPPRPLTVVLARSGRQVEVAAEVSILQAVLDAGVDVAFNCMEGTCGTCETTVLEGIPEHRDSLLSEAERAGNGIMMICCSRAQGDKLVLDL